MVVYVETMDLEGLCVHVQQSTQGVDAKHVSAIQNKNKLIYILFLRMIVKVVLI